MLIEKPYKIAIIDDEPMLLDIMERILRKQPDVQTRSFYSPIEALRAIRDEKIHIVFVDINMPEMFGDDLLRECMNMKQGIQVYIVTGTESVTIANRCLNAGARGVIFKPFNSKDLSDAVTDAIRFLDRWNGLAVPKQKKAG